MTCNEDLLTLYYYQELDEEQSQLVDSHLQECAACRQALTEIQSSLAVIPEVPLQLSPAERHRFAAKVAERAQRRRTAGRPIWSGAVVALSLVAVVLLWSPLKQPASDSSGSGGAAAMAELDMLEQFELLQELELIRNLDLLQEMEQLG